MLEGKIILQIYHVSWILKKLSIKKRDPLMVTPVKIRNKNCAWVGWWLYGIVPILLAKKSGNLIMEGHSCQGVL